MNNNVTRSALHAPWNAIWRVTIDTYPWGSRRGASDPSLAPMAFMDELATNASANGVRIVWYSGNDDALTTHFSTEVAIQVRLTSMTWAIR
jgi:carboxypeptidase D